MNSTTPRRMPMASPTKSAPRRVLGDVTPRALNTNTPPKQINNAAINCSQSPLKQVRTMSPRVENKENTPRAKDTASKPAGVSRKRSINEVEGMDSTTADVKRVAMNSMSQPVPADVYTEGNSQGSSQGSQPGLFSSEAICDFNNEIENPHLGLNESASSGSTTEPDTPPPSQEQRQRQQDEERFQEAQRQMLELQYQQRQQQQQYLQQGPAPGKSTSQESFSEWLNLSQSHSQEKKASRADLLRLRLGFANYKVKTNQISKTAKFIISESEWDAITPSADGMNCMTMSMPAPASAFTPPSTTFLSPQKSNIPRIDVTTPRGSSASHSHTLSTPSSTSTIRPTHSQRAHHVKASLDPGNPIPKLGNVPVLQPGPYSSRMIPGPQTSFARTSSGTMPSSPPTSISMSSSQMARSPERKPRIPTDMIQTPAARRIREADFEVEDGEEGVNTEEMSVQERRNVLSGTKGELTSSVVKESVALGLLELGSGRRLSS